MNVDVTLEKRRRLPWFYAHNAFNTVFWLGMFATVFTLFLDALNLDKTRIGVLQSIMHFMGPLALATAPWVRRIGYKRIVFTFWTLRKFIAILLLLTPWIVNRYGSQAAFFWVGAVMFAFAVCRTTAESAFFPWLKEIIPDAIRGRVSAFVTVINSIVSMLTILGVSFLLGRFPQGLQAYMLIMGLAILFGFASAGAVLFMHGGRAEPACQTTGSPHWITMKQALTDKTFMCYMTGAVLLTLAFSAMAFVPLYLKESVGLSPATVVRLDIGSTLGCLVAALLWGWASDRFGSKPVLITGLGLVALLPFGWFFLPRGSETTVPLAFGIGILAGISITGYGIGAGRYLYVTVLPASKESAYMAVHYALVGLSAGLGPLLAGRLIDAGGGLNLSWGVFHIDKYTPFLAMEFILILTGIMVFQRLRADDSLPVRKFWSLFFEGSPILAATGLIRHHLAKDEMQRVLSTKTMGQAENALSTQELIEALNDPSFNVRYEAIIAIAHMRKPSMRLIDALLFVLTGNQPELSTTAAWALGQLGDKSAVLPLREGLLSNYPLLQARCARALAALNDTDSVPFFMDKLKNSQEPILKIAYASSLGLLGTVEAVGPVLELLNELEDEPSRAEITLAAARLVGNERLFIRLWRGYKQDSMAAASKLLIQFKKTDAQHTSMINGVLALLGSSDSREVWQAMTVLLKGLNDDSLSSGCFQVIRCLAEVSPEAVRERPEYIILALHCLQTLAADEGNRTQPRGV